MINNSSIFGFPIQNSGESCLSQRDKAFLLPYLVVSDTDKTVSSFLLIRKIGLPCSGLGNGFASAPFIFYRLIKEVSLYTFTALKIPNRTMRNNTVKGTPKGDSASAYADIQQIIKTLIEIRQTINDLASFGFIEIISGSPSDVDLVIDIQWLPMFNYN